MRYFPRFILLIATLFFFSSTNANFDNSRYEGEFSSHYTIGNSTQSNFNSPPPPPTSLPPLPEYHGPSNSSYNNLSDSPRNIFSNQRETRLFPESYVSPRFFPDPGYGAYDGNYVTIPPYSYFRDEGRYTIPYEATTDNYNRSVNSYQFCGYESNVQGGRYICSYPTIDDQSSHEIRRYPADDPTRNDGYNKGYRAPDLSVEKIVIDHRSDIIQAQVCNRGGTINDNHRGWKLSFYYNENMVRSSYQFGEFQSGECKFLQSSPAVVGRELGNSPVQVVVDTDDELRESNNSNNYRSESF